MEEEELEISDITQDASGPASHQQALIDDASGGAKVLHQDPAAADNGHRTAPVDAPSHSGGEAVYGDPFGQDTASLCEDLHEPAAHSYFDHGTGLGADTLTSGYADEGFLEGHMQYRVRTAAAAALSAAVQAAYGEECNFSRLLLQGSVEQYDEDDDISE